MTEHAATAEERFDEIVATLLAEGEATSGGPGSKGFGAAALKVNDKIFAMLVRNELVVKLPRARVDALVAAGDGHRFDPGHGRIMKEWVSLPATSAADWLNLALEAKTFVAGGTKPARQ